MASDHTRNPLTAGGGCVFVGVRIRPLGEGRQSACTLMHVHKAEGKIVLDPHVARASNSSSEPRFASAATLLQAHQRGKSTRRLIESNGPKAAVAKGSNSLGNLLQGGGLHDHHTDHTFTFTGIYENESNESVYEQVGRPLIDNACIGFNGTLLAYGQTGSGKTYTIGEISKLGTVHEGVAHRIIRGLYETIASSIGEVMDYTVHLQYVQVHMERIHDLLPETRVPQLHRSHSRDDQPESSLHVREDAELGVYVEGATFSAAPTAEHCFELMQRGSNNLVFAATNMNRHSSRSHAICRLLLEGQLKSSHKYLSLDKGALIEGSSMNDGRTRAFLTLCDLAGSEDVGRSGAKGAALFEAKKINTSLLALGNVVHALTHSHDHGVAAHVPFRDSVLTRLLQDSLGGNTKTSIIVCVSPSNSDFTETLSTLRFASRARRVVNKAKMSAALDVATLVEKLQEAKSAREEEMRRLSEQEAAAKRAAAEAEALKRAEQERAAAEAEAQKRLEQEAQAERERDAAAARAKEKAAADIAIARAKAEAKAAAEASRAALESRLAEEKRACQEAKQARDAQSRRLKAAEDNLAAAEKKLTQCEQARDSEVATLREQLARAAAAVAAAESSAADQQQRYENSADRARLEMETMAKAHAAALSEAENQKQIAEAAAKRAQAEAAEEARKLAAEQARLTAMQAAKVHEGELEAKLAAAEAKCHAVEQAHANETSQLQEQLAQAAKDLISERARGQVAVADALAEALAATEAERRRERQQIEDALRREMQAMATAHAAAMSAAEAKKVRTATDTEQNEVRLATAEEARHKAEDNLRARTGDLALAEAKLAAADAKMTALEQKHSEELELLREHLAAATEAAAAAAKAPQLVPAGAITMAEQQEREDALKREMESMKRSFSSALAAAKAKARTSADLEAAAASASSAAAEQQQLRQHSEEALRRELQAMAAAHATALSAAEANARAAADIAQEAKAEAESERKKAAAAQTRLEALAADQVRAGQLEASQARLFAVEAKLAAAQQAHTDEVSALRARLVEAASAAEAESAKAAVVEHKRRIQCEESLRLEMQAMAVDYEAALAMAEAKVQSASTASPRAKGQAAAEAVELLAAQCDTAKAKLQAAEAKMAAAEQAHAEEVGALRQQMASMAAATSAAAVALEAVEEGPSQAALRREMDSIASAHTAALTQSKASEARTKVKLQKALGMLSEARDSMQKMEAVERALRLQVASLSNISSPARLLMHEDQDVFAAKTALAKDVVYSSGFQHDQTPLTYSDREDNSPSLQRMPITPLVSWHSTRLQELTRELAETTRALSSSRAASPSVNGMRRYATSELGLELDPPRFV